MLVSAFFFAYQPVLYKYLADFTEENKYKVLKIKYLFTGGLLACTILLSVGVPFIYSTFINQQYHTGVHYVVWNAFAFFFWGLYAMLLGFLYFYKKNNVVIALSVFSSVVCIAANYYCIKTWGISGAAYANLFTYCLLFITAFVVVNQTCRLSLPWLKLQKIFTTTNF